MAQAGWNLAVAAGGQAIGAAMYDIGCILYESRGLIVERVRGKENESPKVENAEVVIKSEGGPEVC